MAETSDQPRTVWPVVAVVLASIAAHVWTLGGGLLWQDAFNSTADGLALDGYGLLLVWSGIFPDPAAYQLPAWTPLAHSTFFVEQQLWGTSAMAHRVVNLLLHTSSAIVLLMLLRSLRLRAAGVIALAFAVHPLTVGSVAWISQRPIVLAALLGLAGVYVLLRWHGVTQPGALKQTFGTLPTDPRRQLALGAALTLLAMLAHPVAAVLPAVVWLVAWSRNAAPDAVRRPPLIGLGIAGLIVLTLFFWIQLTRNQATGPDFALGNNLISSLVGRVQLVSTVLVFGAYRTLLPFDNAFEFPRWSIGIASVFGWAAMAVVVAVILWIRQAVQRPDSRPIIAALASYALLMLPFAGLIPLAHMRYAWFVDHHAYLASIALLTLVMQVSSVRLGRLWKPAAMVACVVLALIAFSRSRDFVDERMTWERTLARTDGVHAMIRLADLDLNAGRYEQALEQIDRAVMRRVLDPQARLVRARALVELGRAERAGLELATYLEDRNRPNDPEARRMLARLQINAARLLEGLGDFENAQTGYSEAFEHLRRVVADRPGDIDARVMLAGIMLDGASQAPETDRATVATSAIALFDEAVDLNPNKVSTRIAYGNALLRTGMVAGAAVHFSQAARFEPESPLVANGTGVALTIAGEYSRAEAAFEAAIERDPNFADAFANFGLLRVRQGLPDEARTLFEQALTLAPNHPVARRGLAELQAPVPPVAPASP
jgi:tetratricopeptide (TPR) repeat protein